MYTHKTKYCCSRWPISAPDTVYNYSINSLPLIMRDGWGEQNNKYKRNNSDQSQRNGCNNRQRHTNNTPEPQHTGQIRTVCVGRHCCWRLSPFFCVFHPLLSLPAGQKSNKKKQVYNRTMQVWIPFFVLSVFFIFFFRFLSFASIPLVLQFAKSHCNHT